MKARNQLLLASALLIAIGGSVGAQTTASDKPTVNHAVNSVADTGAKTCESVQGVISACQEAKASGDAGKMKAALDQAHSQLTDVKAKVDRSNKIAEKVRLHMAKIEAQRSKVKDEQSKLDALFYPTDEFIIAD